MLAAARLFGAVEAHSRILHQLRHAQYKLITYLVDLAGRSADWLRAPEDFRPKTTHGRDQLPELVRHLFESYRVPAWLRAAIAPRNRIRRPRRAVQAPAFGWYVHVARGQRLRSASGLPTQLSRKAAHEALRAPARYAPQDAVLYGFLRGNGAPDRVCDAVLSATRAGDVRVEEPWLKLFEKIARTPNLPAEHVRPLLRYARERRAAGASIDMTVPQMLRGMARWEMEQRGLLVRRQALAYGSAFDERWASSLPAAPFDGGIDHTVVELRSLRELFEEGQIMQHCVFTYAAAARSGAMSIWSLRLSRADHEISRVTIRVVNGERAVVEARRRCNQGIDAEERSLLRRWAVSLGLSVASWLQ